MTPAKPRCGAPIGPKPRGRTRPPWHCRRIVSDAGRRCWQHPREA